MRFEKTFGRKAAQTCSVELRSGEGSAAIDGL